MPPKKDTKSKPRKMVLHKKMHPEDYLLGKDEATAQDDISAVENSKQNKFNHKVSSLNHRNSIRIGLVGPVSCGKSTLLNSICVNQYEDMKIKRTNGSKHEHNANKETDIPYSVC